MSHCRLHHFGAGEDKGQLHLPGTEQLPHRPHSGEQRVVDDLQRPTRLQRFVKIVGQPVLLRIDDSTRQTFVQRQGRQGGGAVSPADRRHPLKHLQVTLHRIEGHGAVVGELPPVVDQIQRGVALFVRDATHRNDLGGVDDGRGQPGLRTFMQEDGVEHLAGRRGEAERHVRHAQGGLHARESAFDLADRLDGLDGVAAGLVLARGDGEGEGVDDDVRLVHAPVVHQIGDESRGDPDFRGGSPGLPLFVDGQSHHSCAVFLDDRHDLTEPGLRPVAVFVVHGIDEAASTETFESSLDDRRFGRVQNKGQRGGGGEQPGQVTHVGGAVATDVVDADIQQVRAVGDLRARDLDAVVPTALEHGLAECLGTVGVGPFPDRQDGGVLVERNRLVQGTHRRISGRHAIGHRSAAHPLDDRGQVFRRRPAAASHQVQAVVPGEAVVGVRQLVGGQGIERAVGGELR